MTILDAAYKVLGSREMHYRDIADAILQQNLYVPRSTRDFGHSVGTALYLDIKNNGSRSRFRVGSRRGWFRRSGIDTQKALYEEPVARGRRATLPNPDWRGFEEEGAALLRRMGLGGVEVTQATGDRGIDVWAKLVLDSGRVRRVGMQTKYWRVATVTPHQIRELRGSIEHDDIGILVTTGKCTRDGYREASLPRKPRIVLIDGDELRRLQKMSDDELQNWARNHLA